MVHCFWSYLGVQAELRGERSTGGLTGTKSTLAVTMRRVSSRYSTARMCEHHPPSTFPPSFDRVVIIHGHGTDLDSHGLCVRIATRAIRTRIWRFWTFVR